MPRESAKKKPEAVAKNGQPIETMRGQIFEDGNFIGVVTYFIRKVKTQ